VKKRNNPLLFEKVLISDIGSEGKAIARVDNLVIFVPMVIPGDIADIRIIRKRKKFLEGVPVRFHEYSKDRVEPVCSHFGVCGGCKWQHLPYNLQLHYKEKQVKDNLTRIGKTELPEIRPILGSHEEFLYRNKLEYTFSRRRWITHEEVRSGVEIKNENALGFHIPGIFDKVLNIDHCHLQPEPTNRIRNAVHEYAGINNLSYFDIKEQQGFLRNLIIRNSLSGEVMVIVVFYYEDSDLRRGLLDFLVKKFPEIRSLMYVINGKRNDSISDQEAVLYRGEDHLTEIMDGLKFRIGPKSFYQTNTRQASVLYGVVKEFAGLTGGEVVYDLYTGTGTIANFLAASAKKVVGMEYVNEAVLDARSNAEINNISNAIFFAGDIKDLLSGTFIAGNGSPDIIITDPPRAGMHEDVVKAIISASPGKIVYVSCNPATQARDVQLFSGTYDVTQVQPVDMFPQTHHVENVVLLTRRKS
jgi:23S rRNA (uracil1939-C5)-methyltransferase